MALVLKDVKETTTTTGTGTYTLAGAVTGFDIPACWRWEYDILRLHRRHRL